MDDFQFSPSTEEVDKGDSDANQFFPVEDDAVALEGTYHGKAMQILKAGTPEQALSQNIPVVSVNGFAWGQGHAWLYTCLDGVWYLSDPTNDFSMPATEPYCNDMQPYFLEWAVYEDDKSLGEYSGAS